MTLNESKLQVGQPTKRANLSQRPKGTTPPSTQQGRREKRLRRSRAVRKNFSDSPRRGGERRDDRAAVQPSGQRDREPSSEGAAEWSKRQAPLIVGEEREIRRRSRAGQMDRPSQ